MKVIVRHRSIKTIPTLEVVLEERKAEKLPLIIYYHGWETSKELVLTQARRLAKEGFRVIAPDAMYHGERKVGPKSMIPSMTFWSSIQYNLAEFSELVQYFEKNDLIDHGRIGVGGLSMGGITTAALLTQHPEIKAAASIMGTPAPLYYIERMHEAIRKNQLAVPHDLNLILSWVKFYDLSTQPEKLAGRPLFFWHGKLDPKIPYEDAVAFFETNHQTESGEQLRLVIDETEGHLVRGPVMEQVVAFFKEEL